MRIVFATHAYTPAVGGTERYTQGLAEAMASAGHDVHVLTPNRDSAEAFYEYGHAEAGEQNEDIEGVSVHRIALEPPRSWNLGAARSFDPIPETRARAMWERYGRMLKERIDDLAPDATVALPHAFPNVSAALDAKSRGIAVYAPLLHEEDPAWRVEPIKNLVDKSNLTIAMTMWERGRLIQDYEARSGQMCVAPPGVEAPDVDTVASWKSSTPYVVSIGRRVVGKQLPIVARAVAALRSDGIDLRHLIVGPPGDPAVDRSLAEFADTIEIIGEVDETAKWSIIKGAMASVSLSDRESFGIAAVESWRMRRPVISRRTPVTAELIDNGTTGFLVDDSADLNRSLRQIHENRQAADAMGSAGYARATEFSWDASTRALLRVLHANPA